MILYIALDDTDMPTSPGTGRLAREIALHINQKYTVLGITRHQLFVHPDIPYTSHNSAAVLHLTGVQDESLDSLFDEIAEIIKTKAAEGSDPGVCMAFHDQVNPAVVIFGKDAKSMILTQDQAITLAMNSGIRLLGLGGTNGGIIGALAAVGLAASGSDGRYIQVGTIRDLRGEADVKEILKAGISSIISTDGIRVSEGRIRFRKFPQPMRIQNTSILLVREIDGVWVVDRRD